MNPKDKLKKIEANIVEAKEYMGPLYWSELVPNDHIEWLINRVKELDQALKISLYTMRGSTSQLDLTISREELNYKEIRKGIEIARKALEESDGA